MRSAVTSILAAAFCIAISSCASKPPPAQVSTRPLASPQQLPGLPNFAQISPVLFRGGQPTAEGFRRLRQMGVKTVVDLRGKIHRDEIEKLGLKSVQISSSASRPDATKIIAFLRIVRDSAAIPVFVHDDGGSNRVGLYVAVYRIVEQGWSASDAEAELPRFGFNPFWHAIPEFLRRIDAADFRDQLARPPQTQPRQMPVDDDAD